MEMENASPRMVSEEELNKLKRKLEQNKRKLEQTEKELREEKEKSKKFKALVATDVQFRRKINLNVYFQFPFFAARRETIRLNLPDFAKSFGDKPDKFCVLSEPLEIAGFKWLLSAYRKANGTWMGLMLNAIAPRHYQGPFEFEVDW